MNVYCCTHVILQELSVPSHLNLRYTMMLWCSSDSIELTWYTIGQQYTFINVCIYVYTYVYIT